MLQPLPGVIGNRTWRWRFPVVCSGFDRVEAVRRQQAPIFAILDPFRPARVLAPAGPMWQEPAAWWAAFKADSFIYRACCRSSVVEHSIGNGEVDSSILSGSTINVRVTSKLPRSRTGQSTTATHSIGLSCGGRLRTCAGRLPRACPEATYLYVIGPTSCSPSNEEKRSPRFERLGNGAHFTCD